MHPKVVRLADRQKGLVTVGQLHDLGISTSQIRWMVERGRLLRVRLEVFRLPGAPMSWERAVLAAVLGAGDGAVASHTTAAAVWGLRHSDRASSPVHVTADHRVRIDGVRGHRSPVCDAERRNVLGIPTTSPERTIIDWAEMPGQLSITQLGQCVDDAIRRRLVSLERLRRLVSGLAAGGGRRLAAVQEILADRSPGYRPDESDFETQMNRLWDRLGLPAARRQFRVNVEGHSYRLDRAIVDRKIAVEWDSDRYHSSPSDRDYDSIRRGRLIGAGWLIIPVTGRTSPEVLAQAVRRAYEDRAPAATPSTTGCGQ